MDLKRLARINRLLRSVLWLRKHGDPVPGLAEAVFERAPAAIIAALDAPDA